MRKVTTINLNGRAYQLEEPAYEKLQTYLHRAESALAKDPDQKEVLADIEQAIADKCEASLSGGKNVVTSEQITEIVSQIGEVDSGNGDTNTAEKGNDPETSKRLFVVREGAMLLGVCNGVGLYFGIDPNLVRLVFVLLTIFTGGIWIVVYAALALLLPTAKTDIELAEAYGKPITAQTILARAKERVPDSAALQRTSEVIENILRILSRVISIGASVAFGVFTAGWLLMLWWIVLGRLHVSGQLSVLNGWREWLVITATYVLLTVPVILIFRVFDRVAQRRKQTRVSAISESSLAVLWGVAIITLVAFGAAYAQNFRDYANRHQGKIDIGGTHLCVDDRLCGHDHRIYYHY